MSYSQLSTRPSIVTPMAGHHMTPLTGCQQACGLQQSLKPSASGSRVLQRLQSVIASLRTTLQDEEDAEAAGKDVDVDVVVAAQVASAVAAGRGAQRGPWRGPRQAMNAARDVWQRCGHPQWRPPALPSIEAAAEICPVLSCQPLPRVLLVATRCHASYTQATMQPTCLLLLWVHT